MGHFVSSPREREKRDRRDSRDERDDQVRKMDKNGSEETEEIKPLPLPAIRIAGLAQLSVGRPGDVRYTSPSPHPTTPTCCI